MTDYKEFAKQMRENAVKNEQGNIVCSPELWEEIASVIEKAIIPPCKVGDIVYAKYSGTNEIEYYVIDEVTHLGSDYFQFEAHLENEDGYTVDIIKFTVPEIGLTVFLTKEEAEEKLKELK